MQMIVVDWTRMGRAFCLAGVVQEGDGFRTVRPLPVPGQAATVRNLGWVAENLKGLRRWDVVELLVPKKAEAQPPHTEDVWVLGLRGIQKSAPPELRRAILTATVSWGLAAHFGAPLVRTSTSAFLKPGQGTRSLATAIVPTANLAFQAALREGQEAADMRVALLVPGLGTKRLPVKDHALLSACEGPAQDSLERFGERLTERVRSMGRQVAVRLGLSRGFDSGRGEPRCWLMADGFFSAEDPQP